MSGYHLYSKILFFLVITILIIFFLAMQLVKKIIQKYLDEICRIIKLLTDDANLNIIYKMSQLNKFYDCIANFQRIVKKRESYHNEIFNILNSAAVNIELDKFLNDFIPKLLSATESLCAAFYLLNDFSNKLELKYSCGFDKNIYREFDLNANEIVTADFKVRVTKDIPDDTIYMTKTFLGKVKPKSLMTIPIANENKLIGILVFVSLYNYTDEQVEIIEHTKHYVGIAVNNGIIFEKTKRLTNELQFQNKLIQDLNEELEKKLNDISK